MKLRSLFFGTLACIAFAGCSSDDDSSAPDSVGKSYVSVRLTMPGNTTRAWDDSNADSNYEDAPEAELKVNEAMFFFFNEFNEGCANATIINGDELTWDDGSSNTIDEESNAVIVIDTKKDPSSPKPLEMPSKVTVVLNPTPAIKALQNSQVDLSVLKDKIEEYKFDMPPFMMSTSVYVDGGKVIATTDISNNVFNSTSEAKTNPVSIPVEKVVAKINVVYSKPLSDPFPLYINKQATATDLYVKLTKAWWIDNTNTQAYLLKNLNSSYTEGNASLNAGWWNDVTNFRSYWANTPAYDAADFEHHPFNSATDKDKFCLEHTSIQDYAADSTKITKVVFAAQIMDVATAQPVDLVKYAGFHYTGDYLKDVIAGQGVVRKYYKSTDGGTTKTQLTKDDIEYICNTNSLTLQYKGVDLKDYRVLVSLKETAGATYYTSTETTPVTYTEVTAASIAKEWQERYGELKYWKGGNTYFFTEIKHNSESTFAEYGVVRNHLYRLLVNSVTGMGTPVPNPDKVIIPERPDDDKESYISAEIKILKYRIVNQSVDLH